MSAEKLILVSVVSLAVGATTSYFVTKKIVTKNVWDEALAAYQEELDYHTKLSTPATEEEVGDILKEGDHVVLSEERKAYEQKVSGENYNSYAQNQTKPSETVENVWDKYGDSEEAADEDESEESDISDFGDLNVVDPEDSDFELDLPPDILKERKNPAKKPYIITRDEFLDDEPTFSKLTYTFFANDKTLADDHYNAINDVERAVGTKNLNGRWGLGCLEDHIVYVRNERMEQDIEIVREEESFRDYLLGRQAELMSDRGSKSTKKMREAD